MRKVMVEAGLNEEVAYRGATYTRHARARFVDDDPAPDVPSLPQIGDRWDPLLVRARLQRMADVFRRIPHTRDTKPMGYRSSMPEPVREIFKDQPGEPMRLGVSAQDSGAAKQVLETMIGLSDQQRWVAWGIANRLSDRRVGRALHTSHHGAAKAKQQLLELLAADWNARGWQPDSADIMDARMLIHRNIDR